MRFRAATTEQGHPVARDRSLVLWCRGLRAFGDGYVSILLPVYLADRLSGDTTAGTTK